MGSSHGVPCPVITILRVPALVRTSAAVCLQASNFIPFLAWLPHAQMSQPLTSTGLLSIFVNFETIDGSAELPGTGKHMVNPLTAHLARSAGSSDPDLPVKEYLILSFL